MSNPEMLDLEVRNVELSALQWEDAKPSGQYIA